MANSEAEICSTALILIGAKPITSLDENSREARLCARLWPKTIQEIIRMAPWKCTIKERELSRDEVSTTVFSFKYSYQLPEDCIRVWDTNLDKQWGGSGDTWQIMSKKLITDATRIQIRYGHLVADVSLFDSLMEKAIYYDLAAKLAYPLSQLKDMQVVFDGQRKAACIQAMVVDTQEQTKKRFTSTMLTTDVR